jgi:chloramphenicol-sensitive protein RarD
LNPGIALGLGAYLLWGLFPLFFRAVAHVPPLEILAHRVLWTLAFVMAILAVQGNWGWVRTLVTRPRVLATFALSALMVSANWGVYILAATTDRVIDATLGYFMNPLVNVMLGALVLHERLRRVQWIAVAIAAGGVLWLTVQAGKLPWIGLTLGLSFGLYALLRKTAALGAVEGLAAETLLMVPVAVAWLAWAGTHGQETASAGTMGTWLLLAASGPVTAVPLLLFAAAARRIRLSTLGLIQYLGPSMQLVMAIAWFGEPFGVNRAVGYGAIWLALVIYSVDGLRTRRTAASG